MYPSSAHVFQRFAICAVLPALAACAVPPPTSGVAPPLAANQVAADQALAGGTGGWPGADAWKQAGDAQLAALIDEALARSPDIRLAAARLAQSQALALQAGAVRLPTLDAQAGTTLDKQSYNAGTPRQFLPQGWNDSGQIAAVLGFDLDLWGRNRAAYAAARSEAEAAAIDLGQARIALTTAMASAYADFQGLHEERAIREAQLATREASARLVTERRTEGLETMGSVRLDEAQVAAARADLAATEQSLALRQDQIAVLAGAGPDRGLVLTAPAMPLPQGAALPADVTTELVGRRPDILAARGRAEAAASRVKVARADFFPAIRLNAMTGLRALGLDNLFEGDSFMGSVGPAINLPLFRGGALTGRYRGAQAGYDAAVADYDRTVLESYRQVADAVVSRSRLTERLGHARAAYAASREAYDVAQLRYKAGLATYLDVLVVEDRVLLARLAVNATETALRLADIALIRALGGGYSPEASSKGKP